MVIKLGKYEIKVKCNNCGKGCSVWIKKGITVALAIKEDTLKCDNCGCNITPEEYQTKWLK